MQMMLQYCDCFRAQSPRPSNLELGLEWKPRIVLLHDTNHDHQSTVVRSADRLVPVHTSNRKDSETRTLAQGCFLQKTYLVNRAMRVPAQYVYPLPIDHNIQ